MANEDIVGNTSDAFSPENAAFSFQKNLENSEFMSPDFGKRFVPGVAPGAVPLPPRKPEINVVDVNGAKQGKDLRVRIMVPPIYLTDKTTGLNNELGVSKLHGIIFPYTPTIGLEWKADYSPQSPLHSNFAINFYQKSSVSNISISGKFTVENDKDAAVYLATVHLLKSLTKMRSGGSQTGDFDSGAPPPVCRLFGHGDWMFHNIPVAITSFRLDLPDSVDYYTMPENDLYEATSVPTVSTIAVTLIPMFSRDEMQQFNVTDFVSNATGFVQKGYL